MQIKRLEVIPFAVPIRNFADAYTGFTTSNVVLVKIYSEDFKSWMSSTDLNTMYELSSNYDGELIVYECSEYVDNGRNEGAKCIDPIEEHQLKLF